MCCGPSDSQTVPTESEEYIELELWLAQEPDRSSENSGGNMITM